IIPLLFPTFSSPPFVFFTFSPLFTPLLSTTTLLYLLFAFIWCNRKDYPIVGSTVTVGTFIILFSLGSYNYRRLFFLSYVLYFKISQTFFLTYILIPLI